MSDDVSSQEAPKVEFFEPDRTMQAKVPETSIDLKDALAEATKSIEALGGKFEEELAAKVAKIAQLASELKTTQTLELSEKIIYYCHNLRGEGGSLGYDLITYVCGNLYNYMKDLKEVTTISILVIDLHVKALEMIAANKLSGDGGAEGAKIIDNLHAGTDLVMKA